jgi:hypothetical protein
MAISHFIITSIPTTVIAKVGATVVLLNTNYAIALESSLSFERIPSLDGYYLSESVKYKTYDQSLAKTSNEASLNLTWKEYDLANLPISANVTATWIKGQSDGMLNILPVNQAVEFVEIVSIGGVNNLSLNGQSVLQGYRLSPKDLLSAIYTTYLEGGGFPYLVLQYQVGKGTMLEPTVYSFTINVASIATLTKTEDYSVIGSILSETNVTYDTFNHTAIFEIVEGYQGGTAQINVDINCPFLTTANPEAQGVVVISIDGIESSHIVNAIVPISVGLDEKGKGSFSIQHRIIKDEATETGTSTVTLIDINGDLAAVSATTYTASIVSNA